MRWMAVVVASCGFVVAAAGLQSARAGGDPATDLDGQLGGATVASAIGVLASPGSPGTPGVPLNMSPNAPFSAALALAQEHSMTLVGDWDGNEDLTADHAGKVAELADPSQSFVTRVAISEHTIANGFNEDIFYFADSIGNVSVVASTDLQVSATPTVFTINLPTGLNAFGNLGSDSHIVVTGLAVSPVVDLTSFFNVNGGYSDFNGRIGEILYVSFLDTGGGFRLGSNNQIVHSGLLAFPVADLVSPAPMGSSPISPTGFPVTVGGSFGVIFSVFGNLGGVAVDDDGSVYYHQTDLVGLTGGNIVKLESRDTPGGTGFQDRSLATNGFATLTTLTPTDGVYPSSSGPVTQITRVTNYSGTSLLFGNITALATAPGNVVYAAVARSLVAADDAATQATEGLFPAEIGPTPSMIISFSDTTGAFDVCSAANALSTGVLPIADGFADAARAGLAVQPGVNNFRVFALGEGPDLRAPGSLYGTASDTLQIAGFQVDFSVFAGLAVDEQHTVYVVSGGTPLGVGRNPSPNLGEVLAFPDRLPRDRRADFVDLRGDALPLPPGSGGNTGDADSDRFDHIFVRAPLDGLSLSPSGLAGIARGFLRYLNRTAPVATVTNLPAAVQGDDATAGPLLFDEFDPSHQVAGGDDSVSPFHGDDSDGAGAPVIPGARNGGFEFSFGGIAGVCTTPWNAFFLNSNGNVTFNLGDTDNIPLDADMISGQPRLAPAWADHNPNARMVSTNNFPLQALGFAASNAFVVRWIDVPQFSRENCDSRNTFSVTLYDDGTGTDENNNQAFNADNHSGTNLGAYDGVEGPTDLRFSGGVGASPRPDGSGQFRFDYGRMDLLGSDSFPVVTGYSIGAQGIPASILHTDVSAASRFFDGANLTSGLMGNGTQAFIYERFAVGAEGQAGTAGVPDLDLRAEGNDPALSTAAVQAHANRDMVGFAGVACGGTSTTCSGVLLAEPAALPDATAGTAYSATMTPAGGAAPYSFAATSAVPPGIALGTDGVWSGTPTMPGTYAISVQVTEAGGCSAAFNVTLNVGGAAPPPPPAGCAQGATYESVLCRLGELSTAVTAAGDLGKAQKKAGKLVTKANTKTTAAQGTDKAKKKKKLLGGAIKALKAFDKAVNSKAGKKSTAHDALIAAADAIRTDLTSLRSAP